MSPDYVKKYIKVLFLWGYPSQSRLTVPEHWQDASCCCVPVQEHKGIVVEQPSVLSSLQTPASGAAVEPASAAAAAAGSERTGAAYSPVSPTEERSPDAVSSASEATESGQWAGVRLLMDTVGQKPNPLS